MCVYMSLHERMRAPSPHHAHVFDVIDIDDDKDDAKEEGNNDDNDNLDHDQQWFAEAGALMQTGSAVWTMSMKTMSTTN